MRTRVHRRSRVTSTALILALIGGATASTPAAAGASPARSVQFGDAPALPTEPFGGVYFVEQQYRDFLGREPDAGGVTFWTSQLDDGLDPGNMIEWFVRSPEFGGARAPVARLYQAALGRMPDESGWGFWATRAANGDSLEALATSLINTPEGRARTGDGDPDALTEALYRNVLGRAPDEAGRSFWTAELAAGRTPASVVLAFSESPEFVSSFTPVLEASLLYTGLLDRAAEPQGLAFWSAELARGRPYAETINAFINGPEYTSRLRSTWCQTVTLDEALESSERSPDEDELVERERVFTVSQELVEQLVVNDSFPDEITTRIIDDDPRPVTFVIGVHKPALDQACLPILALLSDPDIVRFAATPLSNSGLEAAQEAIIDLAGPGGWTSIGSGRGRLTVELSSLAFDVADSVLNEYGAAIESLFVGAFPYPMPEPLPASACLSEPTDTVDESTIGLAVTVDLPAEVPAGAVASGTFTVTNVGTETKTIWWGSAVLAYVSRGGEPASVFVGDVEVPLSVRVIEPGQSTSGPIRIATEACDPAEGHRLPAGDFAVWGTIPVISGARPDSSPLDPSMHVRLPAQPVRLTTD